MATSNHSLEVLESRIAPAAVFTYTDIDGDKVTIKTSKGTLDDLKAILVFSNPAAKDDATVPSQLQSIDFRLKADTFSLTDLTITSTPKNGGDGLVNVGYINATEGGVDLGRIKIDGDLGRINVGTGQTEALAIKRLEVRSLGELGVATQSDAIGASTVSAITGSVGAITVKGNVAGAKLSITGSVDKFTIGKSLIGGADNGTGNQSGLIQVLGDVGTFTVRNIVGSSGAESGRVDITGDVNSFTVKGSVIGGTSTASESSSTQSGSIIIRGDVIKLLRIDGDIKGGSASQAGFVSVGTVKTAVIKGSIIGGTGESSGLFRSTAEDASSGSVTIGAIVGGSGYFSGNFFLSEGGSLDRLIVNGSVRGGSNEDSGLVQVDKVAVAKINGSIIGGGGSGSGNVRLGGLDLLMIKGSIVAGGSSSTGRVDVSGASNATITVTGSLVGNYNEDAGILTTFGQVRSVTIKGSIFGGSGGSTGALRIYEQIESINVSGDLIGPEGEPKPLITIQGVLSPASTAETIAVKNITISGDVRWAQILAGYGGLNPENTDASIGSVKIGGDFIASSIVAGGTPGGDGNFGTADDNLILDTPTAFSGPVSIDSISIGGKIVGSSAVGDNFGFVAQSIGKIIRAGVTLDLEDPELVLAPLTNDVTVRTGIQTPI